MVGALVRVVVDGGFDSVPDFSFIAMVTHTGPFLWDVYCPSDGKRYQVPEDWCCPLETPQKSL